VYPNYAGKAHLFPGLHYSPDRLATLAHTVTHTHIHFVYNSRSTNIQFRFLPENYE
jgi:hypothetical protein